MQNSQPALASLPWLEPGDDFPAPSRAWGASDPAPGLLAGGGALDVATLVRAYCAGVFPWFSDGQPILWWSPDPRMVLRVDNFTVHRSLRKTLQRFAADFRCDVRMDTAFDKVIHGCADTGARRAGTWIVPEMISAYRRLHRAGWAHSVETWVNGELVGGLYCVAIGQAVFGESMFSRIPDASKIALAGLVAFCRRYGIRMVDCQQNTAHLASLGAREIPRAQFVDHVREVSALPGPEWRFDSRYWVEILGIKSPFA